MSTLNATAPAAPLRVAIMGIRGLPAAHGGFESFAERLAPFLAGRDCHVSVYCQEEGHKPLHTSRWGEVERVHIAVGDDTPVASMRFDWRCIAHAVQQRPDVVLILGYNTAAFAFRLRLAGIPTVINMDGIEWSRAKWGPLAKAWLYFNERMGCWLGHRLVADHPMIAQHLATRVSARKVTTIPYGADQLDEVSDQPLQALGLSPRGFITLIARAEPENSILEIVQAFSSRRRGVKLVVLGNYLPADVAFHAAVVSAASDEVVFPGAIYDQDVVGALRCHGLFYVHGHQVGGTNPSLLEAMGAGNAVLAHDNPFNRWVLGSGGLYFRSVADCAEAITQLLDDQVMVGEMQAANRQRVLDVFVWHQVLSAYASLLQAAASRGSDVHLDNPIWKPHAT